MDDELEEIGKQIHLKIPEGATPEQINEIMDKKKAAMDRLGVKLQEDEKKFETSSKWYIWVTYGWLSILALFLLFTIIRSLQEGGPTTLNLWSGSTKIAGLTLLWGVYALRGSLRKK